MAEKYLVNELVDGEEYSKIMTEAHIVNQKDTGNNPENKIHNRLEFIIHHIAYNTSPENKEAYGIAGRVYKI